MESGGLQIDHNLEFQRREWQFQRIGWWALTVFVLAAALGAFGGGLLSAAAAGEPDGPLRIAYERFVRAGSTTRLVIQARTEGDAAGLTLQVDRAYFDAMRIERIVPEPASIAVEPAVVTLRFPAAAAGGITISIDAEPRGAGMHATAVRASNGGSLRLTQLAYF
jgi:hypothetical protein